MKSKPNITAFLFPGLISAGIFLLMIMLGLGFPLLFLASLPVFSAGLANNARIALQTCLIATGVITLISGVVHLGIMFLIFIGLPAWQFSQLALNAFKFGEYIIWYPVGAIMARLSLYACVMIGITVLYYASAEGGISAAISNHIRESFAQMPEYTQMVEVFAEHWNFLIFSMLAWMWAIAIYGHAWLANRQLAKQGKALRESLALTVFAMPGWVLYLLFVAALASLIGSESMRFAGKACFITLLLPYFFLGLAVLHRTCADWPNRKFFLFFIYLIIISQIWMMMLVAGTGFIHHLIQINKRLSSGRISPK